MNDKGWIGVDLDGTLAHYEGWMGIEHIGAPIPPMLERVRAWLAEGTEVRIFTARATRREDGGHLTAIFYIRQWLEANGLPAQMPITNVKDYGMVALWDDRAVQVEINTGLAYVHPHGMVTP